MIETVHVADSMALWNQCDNSLRLSRSRRSATSMFSLKFLLEKGSLSADIDSNFDDSGEVDEVKKNRIKRKLCPSVNPRQARSNSNRQIFTK